MLPIQKVEFATCSVSLVRNQVDPNYLKQHGYTVEAKDDDSHLQDQDETGEPPPPPLEYCGGGNVSSSSEGEDFEDSLLSLILPAILEVEEDEEHNIPVNPPTAAPNDNSSSVEVCRKMRQSRVKAYEKLREVTTFLSTGEDEQDDDDDVDDDFVSDDRSLSSRKKHFRPNSMGKRGRPKKLKPNISNKPTQTPKGKDEIYKCDECPREFKSKFNWEEHTLAHQKRKERDAKKPFKCPACPLGFSNSGNLRRHFTLHLENNPFICDVPDCQAKFNSDYNLRRHRLTMHDNGEEYTRVKCPICFASLARRDVLRRHMHTCHGKGETDNNGALPSSRKKRKYNLKRYSRRPRKRVNRNKFPFGTAPPVKTEKEEVHEEIHLEDRIILNPDGKAIHLKGEELTPAEKSTSFVPRISSSSPQNRPFQNSLDVVDSLTSIIASDPVFKKYSEKNASLSRILTKEKTTINRRAYKCPKCPAVFRRAFPLQFHLKNVHDSSLTAQLHQVGSEEPEKISLMCGRCAYPAKNASDLALHMATAPFHGKNGPTCEKCNRPFKNQTQLQLHMNKVHGYKFKCEACPKICPTQRNLRHHVSVMHGRGGNFVEGPQECKICHKMIGSISSYYLHLKRHDRAALAKQLERNCQCKLCGDVFTSVPALQRHVDCVHLEKPLNKGRGQGPSKGDQGRSNTSSAGAGNDCDEGESDPQSSILGF